MLCRLSSQLGLMGLTRMRIWRMCWDDCRRILIARLMSCYHMFGNLRNRVWSGAYGRLKNILSKLIISRGQFYDADNLSNETWLSFFEKDWMTNNLKTWIVYTYELIFRYVSKLEILLNFKSTISSLDPIKIGVNPIFFAPL